MTSPVILSQELRRIPTPVWLAPMIMLVMALAPWPYGYFMVLRLVVCGTGIWLASAIFSTRQTQSLGWAFVAVAIVYNPIFRVHFEREVWMALNLFTCAPFGYFGWKIRQLH